MYITSVTHMPFLPLLDDRYPHLVFSDETHVLPWNHGRLYELVSESYFVRITARGVQFSIMSPLDLTKSAWNHISCNVTESALCRDTFNTLFFPNGVVDVPSNFDLLQKNAIFDSFSDNTICTSPQTGRVLKMHDTQYEVSLCDLSDGNLDFCSLFWLQFENVKEIF